MTFIGKDVAAQLGVSPATLSLVINGKPGISEKTRTMVISGLMRLGYGDIIKNPTRPAAEPQKTLGFVIFKNSGAMLGMNSFYPLILDGVEQTARKFGYNIVIINLERSNIQREVRYITDAGCVGYVIFAIEMAGDDITYFEQLDIPFVLLDNYYNDRQINAVKVNNEQGAHLAAQYLFSMGHRRIGYLRSGLAVKSFAERQKCADEALHSLGITNMKDYTYTIGYPIESAGQGMKDVLRKYSKVDLPTAFMADNDLVAIGAMQGIAAMGYNVPNDFSIIGMADRPISSLVEPKLTTLRVPQERFGAESVFQLIQHLENHRSSRTKVEVNCTLMERDSVKRL